jgi:hypothetical protein
MSAPVDLPKPTLPTDHPLNGCVAGMPMALQHARAKRCVGRRKRPITSRESVPRLPRYALIGLVALVVVPFVVAEAVRGREA